MNWKNWRSFSYYILVALISAIMILFLPMLGSDPGMGFCLPTSAVGWVLWIATRSSAALCNMAIFHCFMMQGLENVKDHPKYIKAMEILHRAKIMPFLAPRAPEVWKRGQYTKKGSTVILGTLLGMFSFTNAVLTFDYVLMLSYMVTLITGVMFGFVQMRNAERYWTDEFYEYALMIERENESC